MLDRRVQNDTTVCVCVCVCLSPSLAATIKIMDFMASYYVYESDLLNRRRCGKNFFVDSANRSVSSLASQSPLHKKREGVWSNAYTARVQGECCRKANGKRKIIRAYRMWIIGSQSARRTKSGKFKF